MDKTIDFYDQNAEQYFKDTYYLDMSEHLDRFLSYIAEGKILDLGCGSGRDIAAMQHRGYEVEGLDASKELVKLATEKTGATIHLGHIEDLSYSDEFDGIWCCASLLHVDKLDLTEVVEQLYLALKSHGFVYASFKYGDGERKDNGKYYADFNETTVRKLFLKRNLFGLRECYISYDKRPDHSKEKWINIIVEKTDAMKEWKNRSLETL